MGAVPPQLLPARPPLLEDERARLKECLPDYRVVLHNDDVNSMQHVVDALLKTVSRLSNEDAHHIMMAAHEHGQATVIECPKEPAEHYRDGLEGYGLTATIEPVEA